MPTPRSLAVATLLLALAACRYEPSVSLPDDPPAVQGASIEREAKRIAGPGARDCGSDHGAVAADIRECATRSFAAGAPFYCVLNASATRGWREGVARVRPESPSTTAYAGNRGGEVFEIRHDWGGSPPWVVERVLVRGRYVLESMRSSPAASIPVPSPDLARVIVDADLPDGTYRAELEISVEGEVTRVLVHESVDERSRERLDSLLRSTSFTPGNFFGVPIPMGRWIAFELKGGAVMPVGDRESVPGYLP